MSKRRSAVFKPNESEHLIDLIVSLKRYENDLDTERTDRAWEIVIEEAATALEWNELPKEAPVDVIRSAIEQARSGNTGSLGDHLYFRMKYRDAEAALVKHRPHVPMSEFALRRIANKLPSESKISRNDLDDFFIYEYARTIYAEIRGDREYLDIYVEVQKELDALSRAGFTQELTSELRSQYPEYFSQTPTNPSLLAVQTEDTPQAIRAECSPTTRPCPDGSMMLLDDQTLTIRVGDQVARFNENQRHHYRLFERITRHAGRAVTRQTLVEERFWDAPPSSGTFAQRFKVIRDVLRKGKLGVVAESIRCYTTDEPRVCFEPNS